MLCDWGKLQEVSLEERGKNSGMSRLGRAVLDSSRQEQRGEEIFRLSAAIPVRQSANCLTITMPNREKNSEAGILEMDFIPDQGQEWQSGIVDVSLCHSFEFHSFL